jgi:hypothetical protein
MFRQELVDERVGNERGKHSYELIATRDWHW